MKNFMILIFICCASALSAYDGFYIGGTVGGALFTGTQKGDALGTFRIGSDTNSFPIDFGAEFFGGNAVAEFYGGYGLSWRCLYAGFEAFVKYSEGRAHIDRHNINLLPAQFAEESSFGRSDIKSGPWHYGVNGRAGFLLGPFTLLYGRVGCDRSKIALHSEGRASGAIGLNIPFDVTVTGSSRRHRVFFQAGIGIEQLLSPQLAIRADYGFTDYKKVAFTAGRLINISSNIFTFDVSKRVHAYHHEIKLGLSYYFNYCPFFDPCYICPCFPHFCGWYVGAGLGDIVTRNQHHFDLITVSPGFDFLNPGIHIADYNVTFSKYRFKGIAYAGYGIQYGFYTRNILTSVEVFTTVSQARQREKEIQIFFSGFDPALFSVVTTTKLQMKIHPIQCGIQTRIGFLLNPATAIYGTIGTSLAQIKASANTRLLNPVTGFRLRLPISTTESTATLRLGGGVEYVLSRDFHLRGDYIYTDYGNLSLKGFASGLAANGTNTIRNDTRLHISDHSVTLSLCRYW